MEIKIITYPEVEKIVSRGINLSIELTEEEIKQTQNIVEQVLAKNIVARNNDNWLNFLCWKAQGKLVRTNLNGKEGFFICDECIGQLLKAESITRARRVINYERGLFLPTDKTVRARRIKQEQLREVYSK